MPSNIEDRSRPESPRSKTARSTSRGRWATSPTCSTRPGSPGFRGSTAIGHVRYSTAGASLLINAQPIVFATGRGPLALAHNGNLINAREIRTSLEQSGALFTTTSDSEVILHLVARSKAPTLAGAIAEALLEVRGAYSIVILSRDGIFAARDPNGVRPLSLGVREGSPVVASETCAFDLIGARYERDVEPGEIVRLSREGVTSHRFAFPVSTPCVFEHVYFARPDSKVFGRSVAASRQGFGRRLAREHPAKADVVVPVPDSGMYAALGYAEESGIPFALGLVRNHYVGRTFIEPKQAIRHFGVKVKLNPVREIVEGKRVVMVDDSIVRGTTSRKIVRMLREAGAQRGARARVLAADHEHLPLRHRHAHADRAHRGQPVRRGDPASSSRRTAWATCRWRGCSPRSAGRSRRPARPASRASIPSRSRKRSARKSTRSRRSRRGPPGVSGSLLLATTIAFRGATLIDGTGAPPLPNALLVVSDGPHRVGRSRDARRRSAALPAGTRVVDVTGKWIVPGLIDAHVHAESDEDLKTMLAWGVTSVRLMAEDVAAAVASGEGVADSRRHSRGLSRRADLHDEGRLVGPGPAAGRRTSTGFPRRPPRPASPCARRRRSAPPRSRSCSTTWPG